MFCTQETQHDFWLEQQTRVNLTVFAPTLDAAFASAGIPLRPGVTAAPAWLDPDAPKVPSWCNFESLISVAIIHFANLPSQGL